MFIIIIYFQVPYDTKDNKLLLVKYNCYRNIGLLYQEKSKDNLALDYLIRAAEICHDDVHTMYILAQLALKIGQISVAKIYYEKCIERNANHWPSIDGILQLFLVSGNIIEACAWAIHCHQKNKKYKRALNVLHEINSRFSSSIPFIEELLQKSSQISNAFAANDCMPPVAGSFYNNHDSGYIESKNCTKVDINCELLKIHQLNWITLAQWIIQMHQNLESIGQVI